jgi:signal transduction histidine kinase
LKNASVSLRLTSWFSAIVLCGFVLFGLAMWVDLAYSLSKGRDRTLTRRAARITEAIAAAGSDSPTGWESRFNQLADAIPEGNLIQLFDSAGRRLLPRKASPADFPWPRVTPVASDEFGDLKYGGRPFRILKSPVPGKPNLVILVAGQLDDNRNTMARFTMGLGWSIPVMLAVSALGGYFLSRRLLRPVDQFAVTLRFITIGNLSRRLPWSGAGDEFDRLAETCNQMLARLEDAVERINRFTADASHELRSPVALIRTVAEFALRNPKMDRESKEAFEEILAETVETGHLLEDLLTLARADEGHANAMFELLDIAALMEEVCARQRPLAEAKQQTVDVRTTGPAWIQGDRSSLRRLISILLDNAVKYTPSKGHIRAVVTAADSSAVLSISDSGIGIAEELLPRIFDRFVRADPSRGVVNGSGLGLAIAKWIAAVHHATIDVQSQKHVGSVFTVEFKLADHEHPDSFVA